MSISNSKACLRILILAMLAATFILSGCAASKPKEGAEPARRQLADVMAPEDISLVAEANDPWEGFNRRMYNFNARFDRYVFTPAAEGYKRVFPGFVRTSVNNFFTNLRSLLSIMNSALQLRVGTTGRLTGRFLVNSTIGIGGLLDPATEMGLYGQTEDFGQTLGRWGVGPGPYLVLPILGPSSVRDALGFGVDQFVWTTVDPFGYESWAKDQPLWWPRLLFWVDTRANIDFRYYEMGSIYEYLWIRQLYGEMREFEIKR
jgi:phospholipid-binding lipoprotein MlaA